MTVRECLNPCCNGIYLIIKSFDVEQAGVVGLNPCCNGIYLIIRSNVWIQQFVRCVLILVVMEYT